MGAEETKLSTASNSTAPNNESDVLNPSSPNEKSKLNPSSSIKDKSISNTESALEKWSYFEGDNIEICEASNGNKYGFRKEKGGPRKLYFSIKINRFSDIDTVRESFRARFHLYVNWIITKKEYESYLSYK